MSSAELNVERERLASRIAELKSELAGEKNPARKDWIKKAIAKREASLAGVEAALSAPSVPAEDNSEISELREALAESIKAGDILRDELAKVRAELEEAKAAKVAPHPESVAAGDLPLPASAPAQSGDSGEEDAADVLSKAAAAPVDRSPKRRGS